LPFAFSIIPELVMPLVVARLMNRFAALFFSSKLLLSYYSPTKVSLQSSLLVQVPSARNMVLYVSLLEI
jgi:hypothetical protein